MSSKQLIAAFGAGAVCAGALAFVIGAGPDDAKKDLHQAAQRAADKVQQATDTAKQATDKAKQAADDAHDMDAWMAANQLGAEHAHLAKSVGEWDAVTSFQMGPDAPPTEGTGTMTVKPIMGGRYFIGDFHMDNMMGMPFDGMSCIGYDTAAKEYASTWIDSMSTGIYYSSGQMKDGALTTMGTMTQPDGTKSRMKMVSTMEGDNKMVDTFYDEVNGEFVKTGTITYTRKGAQAHAQH